MSLINRTKVKQRALDLSAQHRNGKFTRVSGVFLDRIEARLNQILHSEVKSHPSIGKTFK